MGFSGAPLTFELAIAFAVITALMANAVRKRIRHGLTAPFLSPLARGLGSS
jgi:predicted outer membrane lipoprotein